MKPPSLARALVRLFSDPEDREFLLADLAQRFHTLAETDGSRAARRWYWAQALSVLPWVFHTDGPLIRGRHWQGLLGDLRSSLRTLTRRPLYALGVSGTIGLGLAAATITFAVAWKVWLAPLTYSDPDRVVRLYELEPATPGAGASSASPETRRHQLSATLLEDLRAHSWQTIEAVSAATPPLSREWRRDDQTRTVSGVALSPDGFGILGLVPMLGRIPTEIETEVLLSERFWRTEFGGDPDVVGTRVEFGWGGSEIVGVARFPSGYPGDADMAVMVTWIGDTTRELRFLNVIARVSPGHSVEEAEAELNAFLRALAEAHPEHRGWGLEALALADDLVRPFRDVIALLLAAGVTFLLLAGVNVLGLVAARRVEGRHDRSIRLALGASEGRLLRDSVIEGVVLAVVGSLTGLLAAYSLVEPIRAMVPHDVPRLAEVGVTPPLLLGGLGVGVVLGALVGMFGYLVSGGTKPSVGRAPVWRAVGTRGRRALVVGQVALTTLLVAGGAGILHRVATLGTIDLGFEPEGLYTTSTLIDRPDTWSFVRTVLEGLEERGVSAAAGFNTPMRGEEAPPLGMRPDSASEEVFYEAHPVSPGYFSVMGIEVLAGREFEATDDASSERVVIVSEEFVRRYFPPGTPLEQVVGRALGPVPYLPGGPPTVAGVVRSTRHEGPDVPVMPELYTPLAQYAFPPVTLLARGNRERVAEAVSIVVERADPDLRWTPLIPYTSYLRDWFAPLRLQVVMIGVLGVLGLLLASLGLYSLMAYQVASRRRELGVRKAVGASDARLVRRVLASGTVLAVLGTVIGLMAWYGLLPFTRELVEGVDSAGGLVPLSVALVVGGCSVVATLVPALRVTQVDPVVALRTE